jgi:hypothetical protein
VNGSIAKTGLVALTAAAVLVACQSNASFTPSSAANGAAAPASFANVPRATVPPCTAKQSKLPGTYVTLFMYGQVTKNNFGDSLDNGWSEETLVAGKTPPTPPPSTTPPPMYVYYGTYALKKHKLTGCITLQTTVSGKSYFTAPYGLVNAYSSGGPYIPKGYRVKSVITKGLLNSTNKKGQFGIDGLKATGSKSTFALGPAIQGGPNFDTITVTFKGRVLIP